MPIIFYQTAFFQFTEAVTMYTDNSILFTRVYTKHMRSFFVSPVKETCQRESMGRRGRGRDHGRKVLQNMICRLWGKGRAPSVV